MGRSLALLALLSIFAPACQVIGARTHNLRQLHEPDGHHRRVAALIGGSEYVLRHAMLAMFKKQPDDNLGKTPSKVEDPLDTCVESLLALADIEPHTEGLAARKLEAFARYSAIDPWQISRQVCMRQLGLDGARLKLAEHPPPDEGKTDLATPDSLRAVLQPLIHALGPAATVEPRADVAASCLALSQLHYDLDGILRALAASAALLDVQTADSPHRAPLHELVLDLERRTVKIALERGNSDASPYVRAAAVEAGVRARGSAWLATLIPKLGTDPGEEVPLAILAGVRARGLPSGSASTDGSNEQREAEFAVLIRAATEHPIDRVRVSAMQTLGAVSGAGFKSLREEDWDAWWFSRSTSAAR